MSSKLLKTLLKRSEEESLRINSTSKDKSKSKVDSDPTKAQSKKKKKRQMKAGLSSAPKPQKQRSVNYLAIAAEERRKADRTKDNLLLIKVPPSDRARSLMQEVASTFKTKTKGRGRQVS